MKTPKDVMQLILDHDLIGKESEFVCMCADKLSVSGVISPAERDVFFVYFTKDIIPNKFKGRYWAGGRYYWHLSFAIAEGRLKELLQLKRDCIKYLIENYDNQKES